MGCTYVKFYGTCCQYCDKYIPGRHNESTTICCDFQLLSGLILKNNNWNRYMDEVNKKVNWTYNFDYWILNKNAYMVSNIYFMS